VVEFAAGAGVRPGAWQSWICLFTGPSIYAVTRCVIYRTVEAREGGRALTGRSAVVRAELREGRRTAGRRPDPRWHASCV